MKVRSSLDISETETYNRESMYDVGMCTQAKMPENEAYLGIDIPGNGDGSRRYRQCLY